MFMATKTLTITEDAYNLLAQSKRENESFSQFFVRSFGKKTIADIAGLFDTGDAEALKKNIKKFRAQASKDMEERHVRLRQLSAD